MTNGSPKTRPLSSVVRMDGVVKMVLSFGLIPLLHGQTTQTSPSASTAPLAEARRLIDHADYTRAEILLRSTLESSPDSADAHFLLGLTLFHEQKPGLSLAEYTQGAKLRKPTSEELIGVAYDYILMKDYADAEHWLTLVTQQSPELARGWYLLGRTQYSANRIVAAEQSFLACLRINPRDVRAEYNLGLVYENSERPALAIDAYKSAIGWQQNSSVKDPQPMLDLGMLLRHQGHVEEALPYLKAAEVAGPKNPAVHAEMGRAYEQLDRLDDSIAELKQALMLKPDVEALHFFLGRVYRRAGRTEESAKEFAEAAKVSGSKSNGGVPNEDISP